MTSRALSATWVLLLTAACGGSAPPPEPPTSEAPAAAEAEPAKAAAAPEETAAARKEEAAPSPEPEPEAKPPPAEESSGVLKGRDVVYRPSAQGLVIEVEGVKLSPKAEPVLRGTGWGLNLAIDVKGTDSHPHRLLRSKRGPLMIAGEIDRGGGKKERFTDEREGGGEELIVAKGSADFEQRVDKVIYGGQSLTLHVGLWGLGRGDEERRPLKKLFIVRMVPGAKKPAAVISPPE